MSPDYEIKIKKEEAAEWEADLCKAALILHGADELSFDARCHMLVDQGFHCLRAPDVIRQYDLERRNQK